MTSSEPKGGAGPAGEPAIGRAAGSLSGRAREPAAERILASATELFKSRGYHGTSMRQLAAAVKIEAASLYYHFPSKQHILVALFDRIMDELLAGLDDAIASGADAAGQLRAVVRFHVLAHIARQGEAFISHSELRSLTPENQRKIVGKRDEYERKLRALLDGGVRDGLFEIADVRLTSTAILVMCSGVSDWFEEGGRLTADEIVTAYTEMVLRLVSR